MISETTTVHNYVCVGCKKTYTRKSSLDKHRILCEFKMKTAREKTIEEEEQDDVPNHLQLVKIVQELSLKLSKMEEKMAELQKWTDRKKKKIDIISWLDANVTPTIGFLEWIHSHFTVKASHFERLMDSSLFLTIQEVFEYNLCQENEFVYPIRCFSQKQGIFYIGEKTQDNSNKWRQMELADMKLLLKTFQNQMIQELTNWKKENQTKFDNSDTLCEQYQKAIIKLMNISYSQDANFSRIKNNLFHYLKTDLKTQIDYEFE